jgi:hypothetical protein
MKIKNENEKFEKNDEEKGKTNNLEKESQKRKCGKIKYNVKMSKKAL